VKSSVLLSEFFNTEYMLNIQVYVSIVTYNNNNDYFTALCPGLPWWAGTRRNTHPPTILIIIQSLSASSIYHKLRAWQSFHTTSFHALFGLPLGLEPSTSYSIHFFTQSVFFSQHMPIPSQPVLL